MDDIKVNKDTPIEMLEIISNTSLSDFLKNEENCENDDVDSIFDEISRQLTSLSDNKFAFENDNRTIEDILKEAESLINQPLIMDMPSIKMPISISCESTPLEIKNNILDQYDYSITLHDDDTSDRTLLNDQLDTLDSCPSSPSLEFSSSMVSKKSSSSRSRKSSKSKSPKKDKDDKKQLDEENHPIIPTQNTETSPIEDNVFEFNLNQKILCDKSTAPSPTLSIISSATSINSNWQRERELENTNEDLQEKIKDSEERLQSLRIQYDSLSQIHRVLRENHLRLQEESDKLKIDYQILDECANVLRCELQGAKKDHESAIEIQKFLQHELEENRVDKKKFQEITERDSKTIQDLQRQCKEMERILMRKHPDSVSALIVASKNSSMQDSSASTRKLLEERIAQLEADAKEQDKKAQNILASVQARFQTVQAKYETHIQDLETQVLNLQQINNEQLRELTSNSTQNYNEPGIDESTQTLDIPERETVQHRTIGIQTANSTSNPPSRANSSQSISAKKNPKIPTSQSDSSIPPKDDAHLLATIRGMRVELAIKDKAVQRITRDMEECKKTIKKLQKERDNYLSSKEKEKPSATPSRKTYNPNHYQENFDSHALKEAMEKMKRMECDFKSLYEKRLKDLKTLQSAHEKELSASHDTIRILQTRLEEQTSSNDRRRGQIDYYALKAKKKRFQKIMRRNTIGIKKLAFVKKS
ncbi:unnamed protein product [Chironomus riparius]|uniref:Centrosomal protein of 162 kDa n=1 Tax=Chironomus riparius TaxID=315576 RepID=A0A9P0ITS0_9DIPT|nr:unnamed protein product [Chironomus riparius]